MVLYYEGGEERGWRDAPKAGDSIRSNSCHDVTADFRWGWRGNGQCQATSPAWLCTVPSHPLCTEYNLEGRIMSTPSLFTLP